MSWKDKWLQRNHLLPVELAVAPAAALNLNYVVLVVAPVEDAAVDLQISP